MKLIISILTVLFKISVFAEECSTSSAMFQDRAIKEVKSRVSKKIQQSVKENGIDLAGTVISQEYLSAVTLSSLIIFPKVTKNIEFTTPRGNTFVFSGEIKFHFYPEVKQDSSNLEIWNCHINIESYIMEGHIRHKEDYYRIGEISTLYDNFQESEIYYETMAP